MANFNNVTLTLFKFRDINGDTPLCFVPWDQSSAFKIMKLLIDAGVNPLDYNFQVIAL